MAFFLDNLRKPASEGRTILYFNEARDDGWQWHQLDHMQIICASLQTDNHASTTSLNFFTGRMLFLPPNHVVAKITVGTPCAYAQRDDQAKHQGGLPIHRWSPVPVLTGLNVEYFVDVANDATTTPIHYWEQRYWLTVFIWKTVNDNTEEKLDGWMTSASWCFRYILGHIVLHEIHLHINKTYVRFQENRKYILSFWQYTYKLHTVSSNNI